MGSSIKEKTDKAVVTNTAKSKTPVAALTPDSLVWKHSGDNLQMLMAGSTIGLQVGHPVVGAGVGDHSSFVDDPWGRLERTLEWGSRLIYGGEGAAQQAAKDLREMHKSIKGENSKGEKYFALNPEAYAWVHMTTYYTLLKKQEMWGEKPFTKEEKSELYDQWRQQGLLMGIRAQDMPVDADAFWPYFDDMVENRWENTDMVQHIMNSTLNELKKPPMLDWLPVGIWNRAYSSVGGWMRINTVATLPPSIRKRAGLKWGAVEKMRFRLMQGLVRMSLPLIPDRLRYQAPVYESLKNK